MQNNNIINSFNIYSENITYPNTVNDYQVAVATNIKLTKMTYNYGWNVGLMDKDFILNSIYNLGVKEKKEVDFGVKDSLLYSFISSQLITNGFDDVIIELNNYSQTKELTVIINRQELNNQGFTIGV